MCRSNTVEPTAWLEKFLQSLWKARSFNDFGTISLDVKETYGDTCRTERDVT
jgi:hypothetical protein